MDQLIEVAAKHVRSFGAAEVSLALDGLARLRCQPPTVLLDALAQQVFHYEPPLLPLKARSHCTSMRAPIPLLLLLLSQQVKRRRPCVLVLCHQSSMHEILLALRLSSKLLTRELEVSSGRVVIVNDHAAGACTCSGSNANSGTGHPVGLCRAALQSCHGCSLSAGPAD